LTILEILMLVAAPLLISLMTAVHQYAPPERKGYSLAALAFMISVVVITSSVHFVQLTILRQIEPGRLPFLLRRDRWPTITLGMDLLAWGPLLGLSLLFAAPAFRGSSLFVALRVCMTTAGVLCLANIVGPVLGDLRFTILGVVGYVVLLPVACILLAIVLARAETCVDD